MTQMKELQDKARELGFIIKKGPTKFSGYILKLINVPKRPAAETNSIQARKATIDEATDDEELQIDAFPVGDDYKASLADIEDYLESYAADIAAGRVKQSDEDNAEAEVETSANVPKVKPPSRQRLHAMLNGREDAAEIKALAKSANVDLKPTVTLHDLNREVRALKSRTEFDPKWNSTGHHDINENDEDDGGRALREYLAEVERQNRNCPPPDKGTPDFAAPKAATGFEVATIGKRRIAKQALPKARTLLTIATAIRIAIAKGDKAGAGKLLIEAKDRTLDHGEFTQWAERETGLTSRTCRNYMAMAQNGK
jgi:hypothetical protein